MKISSLAVRDPRVPATNPPHQVPIVAASSFVFDSLEQGVDIFDGKREGHIYGRFGNPTVDAAAAKIAALESIGLDESAVGLFCASGMAAIATVLQGLCRPGHVIVTSGDLYGGTSNLIDRLCETVGIKRVTTDLRNSETLEDRLAEYQDICIVYVETPSNPTLRCTDLALVADLAHHYGGLLVVDNTFATPVTQRPLLHGADVVVHSTTKYLNGHGTGIGGAVVYRDRPELKEAFTTVYRLHGGNGNPWDAWLVLNGIKTLPLRMERHSDNALRVARYLEAHPRVEQVNYPGLEGHPDCTIVGKQMDLHGGMLSFSLSGGMEAAGRFMNGLEFCTITPTLGDVDTLVLHPATMSHRGLDPETRRAEGITDGLVRISVGIEDVADILSDLRGALTG